MMIKDKENENPFTFVKERQGNVTRLSPTTKNKRETKQQRGSKGAQRKGEERKGQEVEKRKKSKKKKRRRSGREKR